MRHKGNPTYPESKHFLKKKTDDSTFISSNLAYRLHHSRSSANLPNDFVKSSMENIAYGNPSNMSFTNYTCHPMKKDLYSNIPACSNESRGQTINNSQTLDSATSNITWNQPPKNSTNDSQQNANCTTLQKNVTKQSAPVYARPLLLSSHSRIDSSLVPRPLHCVKPLTQLGGPCFDGKAGILPPSSTSQFTAVSLDNASCRFIRTSLYQIPISYKLQDASNIPFVAVIQPFPCLGDFESPVPLVDLTKEALGVTDFDNIDEEGPLRCTRCHAYGCPFTQFKKDHTLAICCFCGHTFSVPRHYQLALADVGGLSGYTIGNTSTRSTESVYGIVDYVAPRKSRASSGLKQLNMWSASTNKDISEPNLSHGYCFVIDTSSLALKCGFTAAAAGAVQYALDTLPSPEITYVSFVTFHKDITFYSFPSSGGYNMQYIQALVVSDITEPFVPANSDDLLINAEHNKLRISQFLETLRCKRGDNTNNAVLSSAQSCGNAALKAAYLLLENSKRVGTIMMFYGTYPSIGLGALTNVALASLASKDKEIPYFTTAPHTIDFYEKLAMQLIKQGVSVDIFGSSSCASPLYFSHLSYICTQTGGQSHFYPNFQPSRDFTQLCYDVARLFQNAKGFKCSVKLRCSCGITVKKQFTTATAFSSNSQTLQTKDPSYFCIPRIDSLGSFVFLFQYTGNFPAVSRYAYIQFACLHTSPDGQERIRVATLSIQLATTLGAVFRYADVESLIAYYVRLSLDLYLKCTKNWKEVITTDLINVLFSYRLHCASTSTSGQLILPDALKTLPLLVSSLLKHSAFKSSCTINSDSQSYFLSRLSHSPLHLLLNWIYPRLYVLYRSNMKNDEDLLLFGTPTGLENQVHSPPVVPPSGTQIFTDGIYLLDNSISFYIYIGESVTIEFLNELFNNVALSEMPEVITVDFFHGNLGERIRSSIDQIKREKSRMFPYQPLYIKLCAPAFSLRSQHEHLIFQYLVEDRQGPEPSYIDFLCQLHRELHLKLEDL